MAGDARERDDATLTPAQRDEVPAHLAFAQRVHLSSREVMLVTYDADRQELMAAQRPSTRDASEATAVRGRAEHASA